MSKEKIIKGEALEHFLKSYRIEAASIISGMEQLDLLLKEINPNDEVCRKISTPTIIRERRLKWRQRLAKLNKEYISWGMNPSLLHEELVKIYSDLSVAKENAETNHGMKR